MLLEQRLGRPVGRFTLNGWMDELGGRAKTPLEVSAELRPPGWGGFLGVDGKTIYIRGEEAALMVGVDQGTRDVVHAVVSEIEGEEVFERLVREAVTEAGYRLKGLVMDAADARSVHDPPPGRGMPADANVTENVIKQLGKKLRLIEGIASLESAERFSRLLVGCYRFKRFTDSCRRGRETASHRCSWLELIPRGATSSDSSSHGDRRSATLRTLPNICGSARPMASFGSSL